MNSTGTIPASPADWRKRLARVSAPDGSIPPPLILDGGLSTQLERRGHRLLDALWSARVLLDAPDEIEAAHLDFLRAGANVISTASYQATVPGFLALGLSRSAAFEALQRSVNLAERARARFLSERVPRFAADLTRVSQAPPGSVPANSGGASPGEAPRGSASSDATASAVDSAMTDDPRIAASMGPYGAYLADGSEYRGDDPLSVQELMAFHRDRFELLADTSADLLLFETLPSLREVEAALLLARTRPDRAVWISVTCRDGGRLASGEPVDGLVPLIDQARERADNVVMVGVNCTAPHLISELLARLATVTVARVVYPNSGEGWDPIERRWLPASEPNAAPGARSPERWEDVDAWVGLGASAIGGCCRVDASAISALAQRLRGT